MTDRTFFISRPELERVFNQRAARQFETLQEHVANTVETTSANVDATETLQTATFVTLSANTELPNEYVLSVGPGLSISAASGAVTIYSEAPVISGGHPVTFTVTGPTNLALPISGILATRAGVETLSNKTLAAPLVSGLGDYANDAAAAAGGVPVGGVYRNGSVLMVRVA